MAVVSTLSNRVKYQLMKKQIDFDADSFKVALMNNTFAFDKDNNATYTNVSGEELSAGNGYSTGGNTLLSGELTENDTDDRGQMTWGDSTFTGSGGSIGPTGAAIVYDDTVAEKTVVGCIDYGEDISIGDGINCKFEDLAFWLT